MTKIEVHSNDVEEGGMSGAISKRISASLLSVQQSVALNKS